MVVGSKVARGGQGRVMEGHILHLEGGAVTKRICAVVKYTLIWVQIKYQTHQFKEVITN